MIKKKLLHFSMSKVLLVVFEKEIFRKIFPSLGPMLKICFLFKRARIKLKLVFITNRSINQSCLNGCMVSEKEIF